MDEQVTTRSDFPSEPDNDDKCSTSSRTEKDSPLVADSKEDDSCEENIEALEMYKLDYESDEDGDDNTPSDNGITAAGGEVLQPGDHVYMWCTLYQHHGIVLETYSDNSIRIAEFTNAALMAESNDALFSSASVASQATSGGGVDGGFRIVLEYNPQKWHKVKYQANPLECLTWRPGTCSAAQPSPVETILAKVQFLQECKHWIPNYHILASNCETVAVWCVTGKWETLQGDRAMQISQIGALSSAALIPTIPILGVLVGGIAMWHSRQISSVWEETAARLNKEFEWYAMGKLPQLAIQQGETKG